MMGSNGSASPRRGAHRRPQSSHRDIRDLFISLSQIGRLPVVYRLGRHRSASLSELRIEVERGERRVDVIEFCQVAEVLGRNPSKLLKEFMDLDGR